MRLSELGRILDSLEGFPAPDAALEQVRTPAAAAVRLLDLAVGLGDIFDRHVVDLGAGTGVLAIGAALLGARTVVAVERDPKAAAIARANAKRLGVILEIREGDVEGLAGSADTVLMNPPFGAQQRHADRPFWDAALALAPRRLYAFALAASRTFIEDWAVARLVRVERTEPVPWDLPRTFPHHRRDSQPVPVDLWVLSIRPPHDDRNASRRARPAR